MIMNLQVLFVLAICLTTAFGEDPGVCQGPVVRVNGVKYVRELLKNDIQTPKYLGYDRSTNSLFFKHFDTDVARSYIGARLNLDTNELVTIDEVKYVGTVAVDVKTNEVYLSIGREIYKYNKNNNKVEFVDFFKSRKASFAKIVFAKDDVVYVSAVPYSKVYKVVDYDNSKFKELESTRATNLVIDDSNNIFFTNNTGLYRKNVGSQETVYYKDTNDFTFSGLTINNAGDIYAFSASSGIYAVSKDTNEIIKVCNVNARGLTFDADDNMIYSESEEIYRLKRNNDPYCA